ncbi:MAG: papain fold toxin domain-containing protein [Nostoc sp.]|uniref:papain fold toxin domain-containing protein n=1 Tax=Nostoc sp. TaxID=1180 RepID=UPI002FF25621
MTKASLQSKLSAIASQFQVFQCVSCAIALRQFLINQNISGKQISLFTGSTEDPFCNIYHERLQQNISIIMGYMKRSPLKLMGKNSFLTTSTLKEFPE